MENDHGEGCGEGRELVKDAAAIETRSSFNGTVETCEGASRCPDGLQSGVEVMCDSCMEKPQQAFKSCLTCQVSYCEEHLRPHLENSKFQSHQLVVPQLDTELRVCERHRLALQLYCATDTCCICTSCLTEEHEGHAVSDIAEARKNIEGELQDKQKGMNKTLTAAEEAIHKLQNNTASIESSAGDVRKVIDEQISVLQAAVEDAQRSSLDTLDGELKQALSQAESIRTHLEQKTGELKKTMTKVELFARKKNDVDFLQEYVEWRKTSTDVQIPSVYISLKDRLAILSSFIKDSTQATCDLLKSTYSVQLKELCKSEQLGIKTMVHPSSPTTLQTPGPDPVFRDNFLTYATNLSFDPDSTHKFLRLTEDNRKATNTTPWQHSYPDTAERFEHWRQVMTSDSLYLGRHYFEVELSGEGAYVGLTYKIINRKGEEHCCCVTGNDFSWCLGRESNGYSAWHCEVETSLEVAEFPRIGCYVDYKKGLLAFYGVDKTMTLLHKYSAQFVEPLYPVFWLSKKDNTVVLVKPGD
ncbi:tripartite motif-containing protein 16-like protein [Brachyhypopomus gauderio]|uniref:tripartite motif-containing protein 16-like protein n=1 Tax=Brachyhypopomus gauderio TaxID=698409 RepID=UPI0040425008